MVLWLIQICKKKTVLFQIFVLTETDFHLCILYGGLVWSVIMYNKRCMLPVSCCYVQMSDTKQCF